MISSFLSTVYCHFVPFVGFTLFYFISLPPTQPDMISNICYDTDWRPFLSISHLFSVSKDNTTQGISKPKQLIIWKPPLALQKKRNKRLNVTIGCGENPIKDASFTTTHITLRHIEKMKAKKRIRWFWWCHLPFICRIWFLFKFYNQNKFVINSHTSSSSRAEKK